MTRIAIIFFTFHFLSSSVLAQFGPENLIVGGLTYGDDVASVDLDGDGDQDPIVISNQDNTLMWFENLGGGNLGLQQILLVDYQGLKRIWTPDLDNDGDADILVSGGGPGMPGGVFWLENLVGMFAPVDTIYMHFDVLTNSCPADLDNDGDYDVIANLPYSDEIVYFENLGGANFGNYEVMNNADGLTGAIEVADMDNDNDLDLVFSIYNNDFIAWQENLGGLSFAPYEVLDNSLLYATDLKLGDLDNDGLIDIVSLSHDTGEIGWFKNYGSGNFSTVQLFNAFVPGANEVELCDLDNDNDIDIAVCGSSTVHTIKWIENLNGTYFYPAVLVKNYYSANALHCSDMDNDGDYDILAASFHGHKASWFENYSLESYQARGKCFVDFDQDGEIDSNDAGISQFPVLSFPQSSFAYTYSDGRYVLNFDSTVTMNYQILPSNTAYWNLTTDSAYYTVNVDPNFTFMDSLNFGFFPDTLVDSITIDLVGAFPRCNTIINYWLTIKNNGTTIPSGTIELVLADSIGFVSSSVLPDSIVGQKIYWHYDSLFYFSSEQILVSVQMPSFLSMGDLMINQANVWVDSLQGEIYSSELIHGIACAYDPNDKTSLPFTTDLIGSIPVETPYLEYTIRFQNTGNDTAINVIIKDELHPNLDWTTLTPLSYSHNMALDFNPESGEISFIFDHIYLPDSSTNESASHGFVKYRIELNQGLSAGDVITNTAEIYFDYNPAVITNTVINTLYSCYDLLSTVNSENSACAGDTINGSSGLMPWDLNTQWSIGGTVVSTSEVLSWTTDTPGTYDLVLALNNDYCYTDSLISFVISPEYFDTTIISICEGDSVLVFGNYIKLSGIYSNSQLTFNGCDSVNVVDLTIISCLGLNHNQKFDVTIFPNPAYDEFTIFYGGESISGLNLEIWDVAGRLVYSEGISIESDTNINTTFWESGVYVVILIDDESKEIMHRSKLIVSR